ncbi:MAG: hypothetical protein WAY02_07360 [Burkholderiaceae bacterium]
MPAWLTPQFLLNLLMAVIMGIVAIDRIFFRARKQNLEMQQAMSGKPSLQVQIDGLTKLIERASARSSDMAGEVTEKVGEMELQMARMSGEVAQCRIDHQRVDLAARDLAHRLDMFVQQMRP